MYLVAYYAPIYRVLPLGSQGKSTWEMTAWDMSRRNCLMGDLVIEDPFAYARSVPPISNDSNPRYAIISSVKHFWVQVSLFNGLTVDCFCSAALLCWFTYARFKHQAAWSWALLGVPLHSLSLAQSTMGHAFWPSTVAISEYLKVVGSGIFGDIVLKRNW